MKLRCFAAVMLFVFAAGCGASASSPTSVKKWLCYEPCVVQLTGKLTKRMKYGQPNYGENPKTDARVKIYVLLLEKPVNVKGDPSNDLDSDTFKDIKAIQLAFDPSKIKLSGYVGKQVTVKGTLFEAETGHHYTKVLMMVHQLAP